MNNHSRLKEPVEHGTPKAYVLGFVLSLLLTLSAYLVVTQHLLTGWALGVTIAVLGLLQAWVQLVLFLRLGKEPKPRWNLIMFLFMVMVTVLVVFGSMWIMANLDYNLMGT